MSMPDDEFKVLMKQALSGSEGAARELFNGFEPLLMRAIRRRLDRRVRSQFDSFDIAQDVWASFFAEDRARRVFADSDHLLAFLTTLAQNKVADATRKRLGAQKCNLNREQSIDDSRRFDKNSLKARQPTPSQVVMTKEAWTEFLRRQPPVYRRVFVMLGEGKRPPEIAQEIGIDERTVRRIAERLSGEGAS